MADIKSAIEYAKNNPDSTFATELRRRIETGSMDKELIAAGLKEAPAPEKKSGFMAAIKDIPSDIKEGFNAAKDAVVGALDKSDEARQQVEGTLSTDANGIVTKKAISPLAGTVKTIGAGLSAGSRVIGEGIKTLGKFFVSPKSEDAIATGTKAVVDKLVPPEKIKAVVDSYNALSDTQKAYVDGIVGAGEGLTAFLGLGGASKVAKEGAVSAVDAAIATAKTATEDVLKAGAKAKTAVVDTITPVVDKVTDVAKGAKSIAQNTMDSVARIPARVETNLAEKEAARAAVQKLPTDTARKAAQDGIDIPDIETVLKVSSAAPAQKEAAKSLVDTVKAFAKGDTKVNPIETVGKPIVARLKALDKAREKVGARLGELAKNLGSVTTKDLAAPVYNSLRKVPGLDGLGISKKGILDFKNTTLASSLTKGDRSEIQRAFSEAIRSGSGLQKHKFRQELFEVLGGKKNARVNLTETQSKALDAIRSGLSTVLESKNVGYKNISAQYRKVITPLKDMRKAMKIIDPSASEDILDMKAGLLARRLTSNASSNPEIRNILRSMDEAIGKKGASAVKVEDLQDLYNVLDKYYDIAGKTGFQGQIKSALGGATGFGDFFSKLIGGVAGETSAVRQKALEKVLLEALK